MKNTLRIIFLTSFLLAALCAPAHGQKKMKNTDVAQALQGYFTLATEGSVSPDSEGFIRRWMLLDPISKPNSTNQVFTKKYTRDAIMTEYFPGQLTVMPKDGDRVKVTMEYQPPVDVSTSYSTYDPSKAPKMVNANLYWHALDSDHFFVKLFRFAAGLDKDRYGAIFWSVTVINCDEDIENVRLSIGANCGGLWWLNGEELLLLSGDRHMGVDSYVSKRITLKKGRNVLRGATINGIGMSEFCARFIDDDGKPVTNFTVSCN
ncbi:MAG: acetylxylan esterase [Bacteroidales bacterium]|nr:acetylxylan esterase [Bacteroidales bacterium]